MVSGTYSHVHLVIGALLDLVLALRRRLETRAGRVGVVGPRKDAGFGHDGREVLEKRNASCGSSGRSNLARVQRQKRIRGMSLWFHRSSLRKLTIVEGGKMNIDEIASNSRGERNKLRARVGHYLWGSLRSVKERDVITPFFFVIRRLRTSRDL